MVGLNNTNFDAFGKLQVSQDKTLFDISQLSDDVNNLYMNTGVVSGSGTATYNQNRASTTLGVEAETAGNVVRRSKRYFKYEPGKGQCIILTGKFDTPKAGVVQRIGYFDDNNGVFFGVDENDIFVGIRSNVTGTPTDTLIYQNEWNQNRLENESSKLVVDPTKVQIFKIDIEWLGVGTVRFGFFIDGVLYYTHFQNHANVTDSVYMSSPNLPIQYQIAADGTNTEASSLETICSTVMSQGGQENIGITRYITRGTSAFTTQDNTNTYALISLRLKTGYAWDNVFVENVSVSCTTPNAVYEVMLIHNPSIQTESGGTASFVNLPNSGITYDISRDNTNTLVNGTVLGGFTQIQSRQSATGNTLSLASFFTLGTKLDGSSDELILAVRPLDADVLTFYAGMTIREEF